MSRKIFIIDTSVLLYDKTSIHSFPGNDIVLPMAVLEELDRFKDKPGLLGESARYVNRYLDELRSVAIVDGWKLVEDQDHRYSFDTSAKDDHPTSKSLDKAKNDNKIIACALRTIDQNKETKVVVITKDINLRVKCDALGVKSEDYYKDHIEDNLGDYKGWTEIVMNDSEINDWYLDKKLEEHGFDLDPNMFVIAKGNNGKSLIAKNKNRALRPLVQEMCTLYKVEPRNSEQRFAIEALLDPDIKLVTLTGLAGSGKTFLSLMAALNCTKGGTLAEGLGVKKRLVITRTLQPVGKDLGYLPGSMEDKMAPWLAPIMDNVRHAFSDLTYFQHMMAKGDIEIAPIPYIRGRTFTDAFVIVDEAQNATIHELKTIITRIGQNSKIVLLGDVDQIDTPYIDKRSNGLSIVIDRFRKSRLAAHVHLSKGQRSDLATEAGKIL